MKMNGDESKPTNTKDIRVTFCKRDHFRKPQGPVVQALLKQFRRRDFGDNNNNNEDMHNSNVVPNIYTCPNELDHTRLETKDK